MSFAWPWCFLLLPLPWLLWRKGVSYSGFALRLPIDNPCFAKVSAATHRRKSFSMLLWLFLVLALARPQLVEQAPPEKYSGRNLMLAVDLSASMATTDLSLNDQPITRLSAAKGLSGNFLQQRSGDRIGLVIFGQQAFLHTPLTYDLQAVIDALAGVDIGLAGNETALGDAIALAVKHLKALPEDKRVLVLLTDGANTAGTLVPLRAAWLAERERVCIHVLGIGGLSEDISQGSGAANTLDESTLTKLANQTGGHYLRATNGEQIKQFFSQLDKIEPVIAKAEPRLLMREYYAWPLSVVFIMLLWPLLNQKREEHL